jgi:hypothetical protein
MVGASSQTDACKKKVAHFSSNTHKSTTYVIASVSIWGRLRVFDLQIGWAVNRSLHLNADWRCSKTGGLTALRNAACRSACVFNVQIQCPLSFYTVYTGCKTCPLI